MKTKKLLVLFFVLISVIVNTIAQPFTEMNLGINKMSNFVHFVDIDMDGDFDIPIDSIWINNAGVFTKTYFGIPQYKTGDWGDYDNDGDLDLISGTYLYRNDGSIFTLMSTSFPALSSTFSAWGDYDNDGSLDLVIMGSLGPGQSTYIYHNNNGVFTNINANIAGLCSGSAAWGDYDNDGDLDLLIEGGDYSGYYQSAYIYRNNNGVFTNIVAGLTCGANSEPALWADYDNDGDLDVVLENKIYQNNNGVFSAVTTPFINYPNGLSCGDYDVDGDLDIISLNVNDGTKVYRNDGGSFTNIATTINFNGPMLGSGGTGLNLTAWGDYDNDGNLDLIVSGVRSGNYYTRLYRNENTATNTIPTSPTGLTATVSGNNVTFKWNRSSDSETPAHGLSYNIFIGTSPTTSNLYPAHANLSTGKRYIPFRGMIQDTSITIHLNNLSACTNYYWSVQAIDAGLDGSPFAAVQSFQLPLQVNASSNVSIICGENTQLNVITNYTGSLNYSWSNGSALSSPTISNPLASPENSTLYIVTATDGISCTNTDSVLVIVNNLTVNAGSDLNFSCGYAAQLNAIVNSSSNSINYSWSPVTNLTNSAINNPMAYPMDTTDYVVSVTSGLGCHNSDTVRVIPIIANVAFPEICMVGIDQTLNKNIIIWEKPVTTFISDFIIYKESSQANVYDIIDTIAFSNESVFIDTASYPNQMAYRYKISSIDVCDNVSTISNNHKTIHLTINQGTGTSWNLIWSPYEGVSFSTYNIYRGTTSGSLTLIAQVQSNLFSFTNDPGVGVYYFQIEAVNSNPCNTGTKTIYSSSKSNIVNTIYTNIENINLAQETEIYPNPTTEKIIISTKEIFKEMFVSIFDVQGKELVSKKFLNKKIVNLNISDLTNGIYLIKIQTENGVVNKKIILNH